MSLNRASSFYTILFVPNKVGAPINDNTIIVFSFKFLSRTLIKHLINESSRNYADSDQEMSVFIIRFLRALLFKIDRTNFLSIHGKTFL